MAAVTDWMMIHDMWSQQAITDFAEKIVATYTNETIRDYLLKRFATLSTCPAILGLLHAVDACMKVSSKLLPGIQAAVQRGLHPACVEHMVYHEDLEPKVRSHIQLLILHWYGLGLVSREMAARQFAPDAPIIQPRTVLKLDTRRFGGWFWYASLHKPGGVQDQAMNDSKCVLSRSFKDRIQQCVVCGDTFNLVFSDSMNEWVLKTAVRLSDGLAHDLCLKNNSPDHAHRVPVEGAPPFKKVCGSHAC
jgi:hypothetical protein